MNLHISRRSAATIGLLTTVIAMLNPMTKSLFAQETQKRAFTCNMSAIPAETRPAYNKLTEIIIRAVEDRRELSDGYSFRFSREQIKADQLIAWIDLEKKCCPFFGFEIHWEKENGPLSLHLTGEEGVKPFIEAEFGQR